MSGLQLQVVRQCVWHATQHDPTRTINSVLLLLLLLLLLAADAINSRVVIGIFPVGKLPPWWAVVYRHILVIPPTAKVLPPKNEKPPTAKTLPLY